MTVTNIYVLMLINKNKGWIERIPISLHLSFKVLSSISAAAASSTFTSEHNNSNNSSKWEDN